MMTRTCAYDSDLTDKQWEVISALLPSPKGPQGRPRLWSLRDIVNAIFYLEKTGCQWRLLPKDFPHWNLVWQYFRRWREDGTLEKIRRTLNQRLRLK